MATKHTGLDLSLLGPPVLEKNDETVRIGRQSAFALLAYLVITNEPKRRESLATFLWPDVEPKL